MKKFIPIVLFLLFSSALVAQHTVRGVITDERGDAMPGVLIRVANGEEGASSGLDGRYTISCAPESVLTFDFSGYSTHTERVAGRTVIDVKMLARQEMLDELVVVGYGSMKKSDLTGAVASVSGDKLQRTPASSLENALQGRVAGVTVNNSTGQPGAGASIRIRGIGSVMGESSPLYVVDGMIVDNIDFLTPNDIASTTILKDASATAIYGSRGANGVILVTTKTGTHKDGQISFNSYFGVQNRWHKLDLMKSQEFARTLVLMSGERPQIARFINEGYAAWLSKDKMGNSPYYPRYIDGKPREEFYAQQETDWQDEVFDNSAAIQNYHLSFSGGDQRFAYSISGSYFNQDGIIMGSNYERLTLRINTSSQIRSWLKVGESLSFITSKSLANFTGNGANSTIISSALAFAPWDPTHYPANSKAVLSDGTMSDLSGQISASSGFKNVYNPFSMIEKYHPIGANERWVGSLYMDISPLAGLTLHSAVNMELNNSRNKSFTEKYFFSGYDYRDRNSISSSMSYSRHMIYENTLTYANTFARKHNLSLMVGQTTEDMYSYGLSGGGASILNPIPTNWYISQATEDNTNPTGESVSQDRMVSLLSRLFYSFDDRYLITLNFRADGSSRFPVNTWGYFPSGALAWKISNEGFLKDNKDIDNLKLRLGWGSNGNRNLGLNSFLTNMGTPSYQTFYGYPFGPNTIVKEGTDYEQFLATGTGVLTWTNANGKWEVTEQWNAGLDFSYRKGIFSASADLFIRDTKDMLLPVTAPAHVGNRYNPTANVGTMRNTGIEFSFGHENSANDLHYSIEGNLSFLKNEITALNDGSPVYGDRVKSDIGLPVFSFYGYEYLGVFQSDEEAAAHLPGYSAEELRYGQGDAIYKDQNGDGRINDDDKVVLGSNFPWLTYGINIGAEYKDFDLQMFIQGVYGNKIYNALRERTEGDGNNATLSTVMRDVYINFNDEVKAGLEANGIDWTELVNLHASIPNPKNSLNSETSSRFIESGAYLRLKNIQIGYTIPKRITEKAKISRARLYLSANNLLTFTGYTGYDPEVGGVGVDYGNYPQPRTFMFGINMDF
jgi:TonB-linked SusC/RagA family outer membrane protein